MLVTNFIFYYFHIELICYLLFFSMSVLNSTILFVICIFYSISNALNNRLLLNYFKYSTHNYLLRHM